MVILGLNNNPHMTVEKHKITFFNVTKMDARVIQCYAANKYGSIYTNAYLNIQSKSIGYVA